MCLQKLIWKLYLPKKLLKNFFYCVCKDAFELIVNVLYDVNLYKA